MRPTDAQVSLQIPQAFSRNPVLQAEEINVESNQDPRAVAEGRRCVVPRAFRFKFFVCFLPEEAVFMGRELGTAQVLPLFSHFFVAATSWWRSPVVLLWCPARMKAVSGCVRRKTTKPPESL